MLGGWQLYDFKTNAMLCGISRGLITGITLIDEGDFDRFAGGDLDFLGQLGNLCPFLFVGWRHDCGQQLAQRIDSQVHFRPFAPLVPIVPSSIAAFRTRLQDPSIEDRSTRPRAADR